MNAPEVKTKVEGFIKAGLVKEEYGRAYIDAIEYCYEPSAYDYMTEDELLSDVQEFAQICKEE